MTETAMRANALLQKFGVNTHLYYTDGDYRTASDVSAALRYLGIDTVRDFSPGVSLPGGGQYNLEAVAGDGVTKFNFLTGGDLSPQEAVRLIEEFVVAHPGQVIGIEGPNEINNFPFFTEA